MILRRINSAYGWRMEGASIYHVSARKKTGLNTRLGAVEHGLYNTIEKLIADQHGKKLGTRKAIGDFMLTDSHAVNVKSNNVEKQNYSPSMMSIQRMHKWVFEDRHDLSFIFVDYKQRQDGTQEILKITEPVPIEQISWDCLSIEAQGYGVIQMCRPRNIVPGQTKAVFYKGFLLAYKKYLLKEAKKHEKFAQRFIDPNSIDW